MTNIYTHHKRQKELGQCAIQSRKYQKQDKKQRDTYPHRKSSRLFPIYIIIRIFRSIIFCISSDATICINNLPIICICIIYICIT